MKNNIITGAIVGLTATFGLIANAEPISRGIVLGNSGGLVTVESRTMNGCREGEREVFWEDDGSGEHMVPVHYICRGGRFVREF